MNQIYESKIIENPENTDECILEFSDEMIAELGWQIGDTLNWDLQDDGTVVITKVD